MRNWFLLSNLEFECLHARIRCTRIFIRFLFRDKNDSGCNIAIITSTSIFLLWLGEITHIYGVVLSHDKGYCMLNCVPKILYLLFVLNRATFLWSSHAHCPCRARQPIYSESSSRNVLNSTEYYYKDQKNRKTTSMIATLISMSDLFQ